MADRDLQITGGGGGRSSRPGDKGGRGRRASQGPQFGLKKREAPGPMDPSPGSATVNDLASSRSKAHTHTNKGGAKRRGNAERRQRAVRRFTRFVDYG